MKLARKKTILILKFSCKIGYTFFLWSTISIPWYLKHVFYVLMIGQQFLQPDEVRAMEKQQRKERRKRDRIFFAEMEQNMRVYFADGRLTKDYTAEELANLVGGPPKEPLALQIPTKQQRIRTISAMDEHMLAQVDVDGHTPSSKSITSSKQKARPHLPTNPPQSLIPVPGRPPLPSQRQSASSIPVVSSPDESQNSHRQYDRWDSLELSPDNPHAQISSPELQGMRLLDDSPINGQSGEEERQPQGHIRRNTGNTMFVNSTMTSPDIQGTIRCVCGVYRAHLLQSLESSASSPPSVVPVGSTIISPDIFRDDFHGLRSSQSRNIKEFNQIPSIEEIESFYKEFFRRSQMEHDTIIMSLIYIERLIKRTDGSIRPTPLNWRSMLFGCMILASKVWDDLSM